MESTCVILSSVACPAEQCFSTLSHKRYDFRKKKVCILLGISPASDYGLPTFRNTLSVPSSKARCEVWLVRGERGIYTGAEVYSSWWHQ